MLTYISLAVAVVALLLAFKAMSELSRMNDRLDRLGSGSGGPSVAREMEQAIETNRSFLARLAGGETLSPEQILEGRRWGDVNQAQAIELLEQGVRVLDVREPEETMGGVIPGAIRIPVNSLPMQYGELGKKSTPTLVYCAMGVRSAAAAEFLSEQGFVGLYNLEDGFSSWSGPKEVPDG